MLSWFGKSKAPESAPRPQRPVEEALFCRAHALLSPVLVNDEFYFAEEYCAELGSPDVKFKVPDVEAYLVASPTRDEALMRQGIIYFRMESGVNVPMVKGSEKIQRFMRYYEANSRAGAFGMEQNEHKRWRFGWRPFRVTMPNGEQADSVRHVIPLTTFDMHAIQGSGDVEALAREYIERFDIGSDFPTREGALERMRNPVDAAQKAGETDEEYLQRLTEGAQTLQLGHITVRIGE